MVAGNRIVLRVGAGSHRDWFLAGPGACRKRSRGCRNHIEWNAFRDFSGGRRISDLAFFASFKPRRKHVIAGLVFAGFLAAFYFSPAGTRLKARVRWSSDEPVGGARPLLWRDSLTMAAARPLTGFGPETFAAAFPRYQSVALARLLPDFYHESPHNTALDALTEQGIPGLLIALSWAVLGAYAALRTRSAVRRVGAGRRILVASLFGAVTIGPLFATLLVIAILVASDLPDRDAPPIPKRFIVAAVTVPIALCLAAFGAWLAASDYRTRSISTHGLDRPVSANGPHRLARRRGRSILRKASWLPHLRFPPRFGQSPPLTTHRMPGTISRSCWQTRTTPPGVEHALRSATALAPNWFKPHWSLANLLALTGREEEARREAERAVLLDAGKDDEVTETLKKLTHHPD